MKATIQQQNVFGTKFVLATVANRVRSDSCVLDAFYRAIPYLGYLLTCTLYL